MMSRQCRHGRLQAGHPRDTTLSGRPPPCRRSTGWLNVVLSPWSAGSMTFCRAERPSEAPLFVVIFSAEDAARSAWWRSFSPAGNGLAEYPWSRPFAERAGWYHGSPRVAEAREAVRPVSAMGPARPTWGHMVGPPAAAVACNRLSGKPFTSQPGWQRGCTLSAWLCPPH
jgi:hypothetical protein